MEPRLHFTPDMCWAERQPRAGSPPIPGDQYRQNTGLTQTGNYNNRGDWAGQQYDVRADSHVWNQLLYQISYLVRHTERHGILPWNADTAYRRGALVMYDPDSPTTAGERGNPRLYICIAGNITVPVYDPASGQGTPNIQNPVPPIATTTACRNIAPTNTTYWDKVDITPWNSLYHYNIGEAVFQAGKFYICWADSTTSPNTNQTPAANSAYWYQIADEKTYNSLYPNVVGDVVIYAGHRYYCVTANTGVTPNSNSSYWKQIDNPHTNQNRGYTPQIMNNGYPQWVMQYAQYYDSTATYAVGEYVYYGTELWRVKAAATGQTPSESAYYDRVQYMPWSAGIAYNIGDFVTWNSDTNGHLDTYVCITANTGQTPWNNTTYWERVQYSPWNNKNIYVAGDVVTYLDQCYVANQQVPANTVPTNATYWDKIQYDPWISTTKTYVVGDVVTYLDQDYVATTTVAAGVVPTNTSYWAKIQYQPWISSKAYVANDTCTYANAVFQALAANTNSAPSLNSANWVCLKINSDNIPRYFNSSITYGAGEQVWYGGQLWRSRLAGNVGHTPVITDPTYWQLASLPTNSTAGFVLGSDTNKQPEFKNPTLVSVYASYPFLGPKKMELTTGSITIPVGESFILEAKGAGGGGASGGAGSGNIEAASGGGEGETIWIRGTALTTAITITAGTIGKGGAGATSENSDGNAGGNTTFTIANAPTDQGINATWTAYGGGKGLHSLGSSSNRKFNGGCASASGTRYSFSLPASGYSSVCRMAGEGAYAAHRYGNEDDLDGYNGGFSKGAGKFGGFGDSDSNGRNGQFGCGGSGNMGDGWEWRSGSGGDGYIWVWSSASGQKQVQINGSLSSTATTLALNATGGTANYTWSVVSGTATITGTNPTGESVNTTITFNGYAASVIRVTDASGLVAQVTVQRVYTDLTISGSTTMITPVPGTSYSATVSASGGTGTYTYAWTVDSGATITSGATAATCYFTVSSGATAVSITCTVTSGTASGTYTASGTASSSSAIWAIFGTTSSNYTSAGSGITMTNYSASNIPAGTWIVDTNPSTPVPAPTVSGSATIYATGASDDVGYAIVVATGTWSINVSTTGNNSTRIFKLG